SAADDSATSQLVPSKGSDEMAHSTSNASVKCMKIIVSKALN
ncbi:unnamed protein product, partial [Rotaria socialis]